MKLKLLSYLTPKLPESQRLLRARTHPCDEFFLIIINIIPSWQLLPACNQKPTTSQTLAAGAVSPETRWLWGSSEKKQKGRRPYQELYVWALACSGPDRGHMLRDQILTKSPPRGFCGLAVPATEVVRYWVYYAPEWLWMGWFVLEGALCPAYQLPGQIRDPWKTPKIPHCTPD